MVNVISKCSGGGLLMPRFQREADLKNCKVEVFISDLQPLRYKICALTKPTCSFLQDTSIKQVLRYLTSVCPLCCMLVNSCYNIQCNLVSIPSGKRVRTFFNKYLLTKLSELGMNRNNSILAQLSYRFHFILGKKLMFIVKGTIM